MSETSPVRTIVRNICTTVTILGLCLLGVAVFEAWEGRLAAEYFPDAVHTGKHHLGGLLLALAVPLHVIFIGMILQQKWLTRPMARFARAGIVASGLWLGIALAVRAFVL
ncbi:hypothetical protein [Pseudodesulfovibrio portus]|uniref:Uncharacterized protein n=1 Tax=Pseudodesulfovibrio portus TaxID=231439 RepID=A0ABM8ARJ3_9BACT|nr:hypothetical protein [Pseudodesulfovibrio portus]BDQ34064.1 hypothetical protein JCM14722_16060 [Pseudodesulfovibrio portus]